MALFHLSVTQTKRSAGQSASVHALCNLIDVCADFLQLGGHCFHVAVIQPDHIAVYPVLCLAILFHLSKQICV